MASLVPVLGNPTPEWLAANPQAAALMQAQGALTPTGILSTITGGVQGILQTLGGGQGIASLLGALQGGGNQLQMNQAGVLAGLPAVIGAAGRSILPAIGGAVALTEGASMLGSLFGGSAEKIPRTITQVVTDKNGNQKVLMYVYRGQPVLYSGDLAAARRVRKIARRVASKAGIGRRGGPRTMCGTCARTPCKCGK